jgi:hypothetical protein
MAYTGVIKFISDTTSTGLVYQTEVGSSDPDGFRLVHSPYFSSYVVDHTITYTYDTTNENDGNWITISAYV